MVTIYPLLIQHCSSSKFVHKIIGTCCYYSNSDSVPSPDHADVRSPSEGSSGVNMDNADKLPSPNDSGTVSPNREGITEGINEAMNGNLYAKQKHLGCKKSARPIRSSIANRYV